MSPKIAQNKDKLFSFLRLSLITGGAQIVVQGTGFVAGIAIIHLLPQHEYAYYTIANTMVGTMTLLADGGISSGVMAEGGKVWRDPYKLGTVMHTGLNLRKRFAVWSLIATLPILTYLLFRHGASLSMIILILLSLIPTFYAAISDSLLEIIPRLHQDIPSLQQNQLYVSLGRLFLSLALLFIFPFTYLALLSNGIPRLLGNIKLRRIAGKFVDVSSVPDPVIKKNIMGVVSRVLPGSIYYCVSSQISIWLISFFGKSSAVAQLGAITRLNMALFIFQVLFSTLIVPRFARMKLSRIGMLRFYLLLQMVLCLLVGFIMLLVFLFPHPILWLCGKAFLHMEYALRLSMFAACLAMYGSCIQALGNGRGWILNPFVSIIVNLFSTFLGIWYFNVGSIEGVLTMNICLQMISLLLTNLYLFFRIHLLSRIDTEG